MPSIDIDGMRVAYEDAGTGLPIVFIPGLTGSKEWFRYQFSGLQESYRIISYDVRAARISATSALDTLTEDLARLMTALKLQSAVLVGHSFGAMIAQRFATLYRQRLDALVLISAFPHLPDVPAETIIEWMSPGLPHPKSGFRALVRRIFHRKPAVPPEDGEGLEWLAAHSPSLPNAALDSRISMVREFDSTSWLPENEAATLVIVGARDREPFLHGAQTLYEAIPDSTLEVIEDGDHFSFYTRHDIVNGAIDDFLTERLMSL